VTLLTPFLGVSHAGDRLPNFSFWMLLHLSRGRPPPVLTARFSQKTWIPDEFELRLADIKTKAAAEEAALRLQFSRPPRVADVLVHVPFPTNKPASAYAISGDAELDEPFGYLGASRIYVPAGRSREIAHHADALALGPIEAVLEASLLEAASRSSGRSIRPFAEDAVEAPWRVDLAVWWPNATTHENVFKRTPSATPLFMCSHDDVDFVREASKGCSLPPAACAFGEIKRSSSAPLVALPQAAIAAGSCAQRLRALGLPLDRCVVPFLLHTGLLEQHGAAYLLEQDLPCCVLTSEVMDLLSPQGRRRTVAFRRAMRSHAEDTFQLLQGLSGAKNGAIGATQATAAAAAAATGAVAAGGGGGSTYFAPSHYFLKTPTLVHGASDKSHVHLLTVCEHIQSARDAASDAALGNLAESHPALAALLPLTRLMRLPGGTAISQARVHLDGVSPLVFPRLSPEYADANFKPPPRALRVTFFCDLVRCIHWLHVAARVVHGDIVPANVMWRTAAKVPLDEAQSDSQQQLLLCIVDFDASLPIGALVPENARAITAENGFKRVYRECLF
jgi:hypothetical protein